MAAPDRRRRRSPRCRRSCSRSRDPCAPAADGSSSTHFTLVPGKGGEPMISPHLKPAAPVPARRAISQPGAWGHALVDELGPPDCLGREDRLFGLLHDAARMGAAQVRHRARLLVAGIVTNGGVASTVRDAHVRDFDVTVLADGCAAFSPHGARHGDRGASPGVPPRHGRGSDGRDPAGMSVLPAEGVRLRGRSAAW